MKKDSVIDQLLILAVLGFAVVSPVYLAVFLRWLYE